MSFEASLQVTINLEDKPSIPVVKSYKGKILRKSVDLNRTKEFFSSYILVMRVLGYLSASPHTNISECLDLDTFLFIFIRTSLFPLVFFIVV